MPDDLHDRDILAWSEREAALLRRLARGERVNDVDWAHLVEEIEDVGLSELNAVRSCLERLLLRLLQLRLWPDDSSVRHWRTEIVAFQRNAARRFAPSLCSPAFEQGFAFLGLGFSRWLRLAVL